jgi:hypothetical protein
MPKDVGAWTAEDCALMLTDYQNETFEDVAGVARAEKRAGSAHGGD